MEVLGQLAAGLGDGSRRERELGQGGMAVVVLAEDLKHRRRVAIKLLKPELSAVLGSERFVREIAIAATLQHPHILPLYDSGQAGGLFYYVMPFVEGESYSGRMCGDRKSTRLNSSHGYISYAVFCLKKKKVANTPTPPQANTRG